MSLAASRPARLSSHGSAQALRQPPLAGELSAAYTLRCPVMGVTGRRPAGHVFVHSGSKAPQLPLGAPAAGLAGERHRGPRLDGVFRHGGDYQLSVGRCKAITGPSLQMT